MKKITLLVLLISFLSIINFYSQNLITNGDFGVYNATVLSPAPLGYTTTYTQVPYNNGGSVQGIYAITNNPNILLPSSLVATFDIKDGIPATTGSGNMMYVDGKNNQVFWEQNPPLVLEALKTYSFSFWVKNVNFIVNAAAPAATIKFDPGCSGCATSTSTTGTAKNWIKYSYSFNPTSTGAVSMKLSTVTSMNAGNNFVIDDISLTASQLPFTLSNAITNPSCPNANDGSIIVNQSNGVLPLVYTLTGAANASNATGIFQGLGAGTYSVSATDSSLPSTTVSSGVITLVSRSNIPTVKSPIYYCLNSPSIALTATPISGAILNWYTTVTGTLPLASAPTPSTALVGSQTYYVSQTVGSCESARVAIVVNVIADTGAIATIFTCVPSQVTSPNSVYFDWNHVPGRVANDYGYSYSIAGGPLVFGRTPLSSMEVFGVLPGQSVEFTILDVPGVPCYTTQSLTCSLLACTTTTVPDFTSLPASQSICSGSTPPILPRTSTNGITGIWSPATISNTTSGTYIFTPNAGQCATAATLTVSVTPNPILSGNQNICAGSISTFSSTVAGGTWSSANTSIATVNTVTGVVTGVSQGTAVINYTVPGNVNCPNATASTAVVISAIPNAGVLSGNQNICAGSTSTFSSTISGGIWSSNNTSIATVNSTTGVVVGISPGITTIAYAVSGIGGCVDVVAIKSITVNKVSLSLFYCDPSQVTSSNSVFFDWSNVPGRTGNYNYSYAINGGPIITGSTQVSSFEVFGVSEGQNVTFTIQSVDGISCFSPTSVTCTLPCKTIINPKFNPIAPICSGSVVPILPTTSTNGITGVWTPSTISNTTSGTYTFTPNAGQCATPTSLTVIVNPLAFASISGGVSVCSGTSGRFNINGTPNATVTYNKNGGSNETIILDSSGTATIFTPQLFANSVYSLVSITSALTSCSIPVTGSATIVVNPLPIAKVTSLTQFICSGGTTNITLSSNQIGTTFDWVVFSTNVTGGSAGYGNVIKQVLQTSGNLQGTVVYTITPVSNGCVGIPITATVNVNPLPVLEPIPNVSACSSYTLPQLLEGSYYTGVEGTGNSVPSGTTITTSTVLSVFVSNAFCSASYPHSITIIPEPKLEIVTENNSNEIYIDNTTVVQSLLLDCQLLNEFSFQWYENDIAIDGATNPTYLVNTVSQNANPRNFTVSASKGICKTTSSVFEVNQALVPAPSGNRLQSFTQGQTLADLEVEGTNIQWYADRTGNRNANATPLPLTTVLVNGATYYASQTINGFESPSRLDVTVQVSLGNYSFTFKDLKFSPNPIVNVLTITSNEIFTKISIYNILGQEVHRQKGNGLELKLDLSYLVSGNYFVKVASDAKQQIIKVIKK